MSPCCGGLNVEKVISSGVIGNQNIVYFVIQIKSKRQICTRSRDINYSKIVENRIGDFEVIKGMPTHFEKRLIRNYIPIIR